MEKEEWAIVLDFLPHGYFGDRRRISVAQAIGTQNFTLLELVPRKGLSFQLKEKVYIGEGKRDKVNYILGRLSGEKLTETAKLQLHEFVKGTLDSEEQRFVEFFNKAEPINTRLHQLELLPNFGKRHMESILGEREKKPFSSFEDIHKRIKSIPDPRKAVEKRMLEELETKTKYRLFVK
ncbi:MAG: DUF655 domain-containing protein [Nanoarchaeota archaeon]